MRSEIRDKIAAAVMRSQTKEESERTVPRPRLIRGRWEENESQILLAGERYADYPLFAEELRSQMRFVR